LCALSVAPVRAQQVHEGAATELESPRAATSDASPLVRELSAAQVELDSIALEGEWARDLYIMAGVNLGVAAVLFIPGEVLLATPSDPGCHSDCDPAWEPDVYMVAGAATAVFVVAALLVPAIVLDVDGTARRSALDLPSEQLVAAQGQTSPREAARMIHASIDAYDRSQQGTIHTLADWAMGFYVGSATSFVASAVTLASGFTTFDGAVVSTEISGLLILLSPLFGALGIILATTAIGLDVASSSRQRARDRRRGIASLRIGAGAITGTFD
jgi:hypothetical protein